MVQVSSCLASPTNFDMNRISLLFLLFTITGCENLLINEEVTNDQLNNFRIYWNDFDRHYPAFVVRGIHWDSIRQESISSINTGLSEAGFFEMMKDITLNFQDAHVELKTPGQQVNFDNRNPEDAYSVQLISNYLRRLNLAGRVIHYGFIEGHNIGYILIPTFSSNLTLADFDKIDLVLAHLSTTDGIIIDIRSNGGGAYAHQKAVASRFIDTAFVYMQSRIRNGPGHNDFDEAIEDIISPKGNFQYVKPIVLLTNAQTASAAEIFSLTLKGLDHISIIGDITAKAFSNSVWRELPNGWSYRMSINLISDRNGTTYEGVGIIPDETILISAADSTNGIDTQLERAIELLQ